MDTPSNETAKVIEAGEGRKRLHKAVQNVIYNEMGLSREEVLSRVDGIIEKRVDHWLATHNLDEILLNYVTKAIKEDKWQDRYYGWNIRTLKTIIEGTIKDVVKERISEAIKGFKITLE